MKKAQKRPVAIDLFAGAGGLSEGLEQAGIWPAVAVEFHPQPALTHAFNHPETSVIAGDIRKLSLDVLRAKLTERVGSDRIDLVVGGPPCQGFSTAGKKKALDPRNSLFYQFVRVVAEFRPRMFLLENVPGFKKMHGGNAFHEASRLFSDLGYEFVNTIVEASRFGVPQRRQRFVMVGWLPDRAKPFQWPDPTHVALDADVLPLFPTRLQPLVTVEEAISDLAFVQPGWEAHRQGQAACSSYQEERRAGCELLFNHLASRHRAKAVKMFSHIEEGGTISMVPEEHRSAKRTMARLDRKSISNAVLALPDDLIHYEQHRIPSVREMARFQSFDDDFVFIGKRTSGFMERRFDVPQYTQVGNAVPPLLARALGQALQRSLGGWVEDIRAIEERRERHAWVRGTSGFAGYTLSREAEGSVALFDVEGLPIPLPTSDCDVPVSEAPATREWKNNADTRQRGQWAPGMAKPTAKMKARRGIRSRAANAD
ncbi:MAG TPA: DNA cytosine methyltransferase [Anaeromyxobacteraceae bacterium]|jgi:DNA (cytosine-5)-methyltransferase 1|nr:DNA cytosine methyltransferase [Anaeromyxobacteraceae bacterium]